ncbi:MAG: hypothetical protein K2G44_03870, partial [Clostridia bacterium]|nr:hypothetical protein [Clostridia bacterium]
MKRLIKNRVFIGIILAVCVAALICCSILLPLTGKKKDDFTANAASGGDLVDLANNKLDDDALDALASAAGYSDINKMMDALDAGTILNSPRFGGHTVTIGGMQWWPVYAQGKKLTLWLVNSIGGYTFSDGTYNNHASTSIKSNNYTYSWIRAAINVGQTDIGYYYGTWNNSSTAACTPTQFQNNVSSRPGVVVAPTDFTTFAPFVSGAYSAFVLPGPTGDNVWLPSSGEVKGGAWGCTSMQWACGGTQLMRDAHPSSYGRIYGLTASGGFVDAEVTGRYHVRPAMIVDLTKARRATVGDVEVTYNGSLRDITDSEIKAADKEWYDSSLMDLTYPTDNPTSDMIDADTHEVKVELNATAIAAGYLFRGDPDTGKGETNTIRYFNFNINPKKLTVPKITNSPQTYDPVNGSHFGVDSNYDPATMTATNVTAGITWNSASTRFDATNAGTYSVKFQLLDTKNYVWDIGANGTTADQSTSVKVDPIKLTIPTITAPQEYSGSVLQFVLADFNAGQYIKVNSASAANGSTVTGASGATIADTTDTFEATKVDKYTVSLSLRDTQNYAWDDNTALTKNVEFEITQKELLSAPPVSSEVNGTGGAEWNFGDGTVTITITDDRATGENINLLCYYDVAGGTSKSNTLTSTTTGNVTTITMPATIAVGKYTLTVELNGTTGDNANYKITKNNTLDFEITSGKIDPSNYDWTYTKDGAAGGTSANDGSLKVPFELKAGSTVDGVKYELSIQIPTADASAVVVDTSKYVNGYQVRSGDKVGTFKTIVALKSIDTDFQFEVDGNMQDTCEVEFNWEIEKGDFNLSNVKWEYTTDNGKSWTEYDSTNPPQYNDGNYVTVRVKATTLPNG